MDLLAWTAVVDAERARQAASGERVSDRRAFRVVSARFSVATSTVSDALNRLRRARTEKPGDLMD